MSAGPKRLSKKRKFVAYGVFYAELNAFLSKELAEDGYAGVEVRRTPNRTEVIIRATRTRNVLGEKGRRIRELTSVVQKRFGYGEGTIELYAERVQERGLCAQVQAESLRYKLLGGLPVRRACYGVLRYIMDNNAKGVEIIVSGKLRSQRAKGMKFRDGYMIKAGKAVEAYVDKAIRHVQLRQGIIGIQISIMLPWDVTGKRGPSKPLPDIVRVLEPKEDVVPQQPQQPAQQPPQAQQQVPPQQQVPQQQQVGGGLPIQQDVGDLMEPQGGLPPQ